MKLVQLLLFLLVNTVLSGQETDVERIFKEAEKHLANKAYEETFTSLDKLNKDRNLFSPPQRVRYALIAGEIHKKTFKLNLALTTALNGLDVYESKLLKLDTNYLRLLLAKGLLEDDLGDSEKSVQTLEKILKKSAILPFDHEILPLTYNALAGTILAFGQYHEAIEYYEKAKSLFKVKYKTEYHTDIARIYSNLGNCYKYLFQDNKAEQHYKRSWELLGKIPDADDYNKAAVAYNIAIFFIGLEDAGNALIYDKYSLEIAQRSLKNTPLHGFTLSLLGQIYAQLGDYKKAQNAIDLAKPIFDKHQSEYLISTYYYYANRGVIYSYQERSEEALSEFLYGASLLAPVKENNPLELANCYGLLGAEYINLGQYNKAQNHLQKAIDISIPILGEEDPEVVFYYTDIAYNYIQSGRLEKALETTNYAIEKIGFKPNNSSPYEHVSELSTLLRSFTDKEDILLKLYKKSHNPDFLEGAKNQATLNLKTLNYLRHHYNNPLAIISANVKYQELFELSLNVYHEAYLLDSSPETIQLFLNTLEASKSYSLLEQLLVNRVKKHSNITQTSLEEERTLKSNLAFWESELPYMETPKEIHYAKTQIISTKTSIDSIITKIKQQHSAYTSFKYYNEAPDIVDLQSKMNENQGVVEYFIGISNTYVIKISNTSAALFKFKKDPDLKKEITSLVNSIKKPFIEEATEATFNFHKREYEKWAYLLYQKLIEPLGDLPKTLTIIPDDYLWNIPFGCLISEQNEADFSQKTYLTKQYIIDYQYSLTLKEVLVNKPIPSREWVGFAPQFSSKLIASTRSNLGTLEFNVKEIESIQQLTGGQKHSGLNATKDQFLNSLNKYAVYHLATHAVADQTANQSPYLAFSLTTKDWKLTVKDIYKLDMPSEMVVLSACNSGQGKLEKGEGMASLSRAFFYAGAKSTIMTQWQVNDKATATIMESFYGELNKGIPKNRALNTAKNNYLSMQKNQLYAHPFYWAGFTPIGSMEAVSFAPKHHYLWWLFAAAMILLLAFFIRRK